jgi:hypothetical protein
VTVWTWSRRRRAAVAACAAAGLLVAVGVVLVTRTGEPPPDREVVADGVRLLVPGDWARNATECGVPVKDTYIVGLEANPACRKTPVPEVDYAEVRGSGDLAVDPVAAVATNPATIAGRPVLKGYDRLSDGRTRQVLVIPDQQVIVVAVSSRAAVADRIMRSVQIAG